MSDMAEIESLLANLGLEDKEAQVYFQLLQQPWLTVLELSSLTGVARSSTYRVCSDLQQKGFIYSTITDDSERFSANPPSELSGLVEQKQLEVDLIQHSLQELNQTIRESLQPQMIIERVASTQDFFSRLGSMQEAELLVSHKYHLDEVLPKKHTILKVLYAGTAITDELQKKFDVRNPLARFSGIQAVSQNAVMFVQGDKERLSGVYVGSIHLAALEREKFRLLWEQAT